MLDIEYLMFGTFQNILLIVCQSTCFKNYHTVPKFSDRPVWADSVDPDQSASLLISVYSVSHSICVFWTQYSKVEPHCSNFRIIAAIFQVFEYLRISQLV